MIQEPTVRGGAGWPTIGDVCRLAGSDPVVGQLVARRRRRRRSIHVTVLARRLGREMAGCIPRGGWRNRGTGIRWESR